MRKLVMLVMVLSLMLTMFVGCGTSSKGNSEETAKTTESTATEDATTEDATTVKTTEASTENSADEKVSIGLILPTLTTDFFVTIKDSATVYAEQAGIDLIVLESQDDAAKQASNVEDLITKDVDGILIIPTDSEAVVSSIEAINEAGIPVITLDRSASGGKVVCHIASDNISGGKMAGEYIVEQLGGKGKVVELQGVAGTSAARDRGDGFNSAIAGTEIELVAQQTADFDKAKGMSVMENILQAQSEINAVFAHNDEMALGAMEAIEAAGRTDIMIVGFDASEDAVAAVQEGTMTATVAQQPILIAQTGIDTMLKVLDGQTVETSMPVDLKLVTK